MLNSEVIIKSAGVSGTWKFDVFLTGWMAKLQPRSHPAANFQFDVFISAGGGRFVPDGETNTCTVESLLLRLCDRNFARLNCYMSLKLSNFSWHQWCKKNTHQFPFFSIFQVSSTRSWEANWLSASQQTSSTGTRLQRLRWQRSAAWLEYITRSSSKSYSLRQVGTRDCDK